jgi:hypothetical protein
MKFYVFLLKQHMYTLCRFERVCELGIAATPAPGSFWRTQMLTLTPRYVLVNQTDEMLVYVQDYTGDGDNPHQLLWLSPGEQVMFISVAFDF